MLRPLRFATALTLTSLLFSPKPSLAAGTTLMVSPSGSDSGLGTVAAPFRQIRRALQIAGAGDTILVADGSYLGFDVRGKTATPESPLTIRAVGKGAVVMPPTDRSDNRDTIFVTFSSGIVIDGLRSFNANRAAVRIDNSPNITIRNGVFGNNRTWGIFTDFSDDLRLEGNECYGSVKEHGIYVSNSGDRPVVRGNHCHDNAASGIQLNADLAAGGDGIISGAVLEENVLLRNGALGGAAINLDGVQDSVVQNNLIVGNRATGIVAYRGNGAAGPANVTIRHNTIDQPADGRWCLHIGSAAGPVVVRNNILFTRHSFRGSIEYSSTADVARTDSDYNVLSRVTPNYGATVFTLAQWQSRGFESHSLNLAVPQLWSNPLALDYRLGLGSPAIDAGQTIPDLLRDITGFVRPSGAGYNLGCYEQVGPAPIVPLGLTSLGVSPTTLRGGTSATGRVTISAAAPSGGLLVKLASNSPQVTVPAQVLVPAGSTSALFSIGSRPVTRTTAVTLTAKLGDSQRTASITVIR